MFRHTIKERIQLPSRLFFIAAAACLMFAGGTIAQPAPQPTPTEEYYNGYKVTAVTEFGWRFRSLDGNENKYRSDLNYKAGFRSFDSNILFESDTGRGKYFDSLLIMNSGWGADPTGYLRVNMEKIGFYKFNGTVRKINYFNNLANFAAYNNIGYHTQDLSHTLGDFDFTLMPQSEKLRLNFGASFSNTTGDGTWASRGYRDDFPVDRRYKTRSTDYRIGGEGKLWGFNWGLTQGFRFYTDSPNFILPAPHPGFNTTGAAADLNATFGIYSEYFPMDGNTYWTQAHISRTFAERLDFTGRFIYSTARSTTNVTEQFLNSRDNNAAFVDRDDIIINGSTKRPQSRADLGLTWRVTDNFRISNTFAFDQFDTNTGERLFQFSSLRNAANTTRTDSTVNSFAFRAYNYKRLANTLEADYQFSNRFAIHVGWRHSKRETGFAGLEGSATGRVVTNLATGAVTTTLAPPIVPTSLGEQEENTANVLLVGGKIKPMKGWSIFWDVEHGTADNVFTRLENYDFTNYRVRSRWNYKTINVHVYGIAKNNENPSMTLDNQRFGTDINNRTFGADIDWNPNDKVQLGGGYTNRHITAKTPIYIYLRPAGAPAAVRTLGLSEYYVRDNYYYVETAVKPHKRLSVFAAYRYNKDKGQGDRISPVPPDSADIVSSYPMSFSSPEVRAAIRISKRVDWNVGYQYYKYNDVQTPIQNYKAHLPYTSVRIYFGQGTVDR